MTPSDQSSTTLGEKVMAETRKTDSGEAEVQAKVDEAEDKGYLGVAVDDRPREDYTVAGAIKRKGENLDTK
jgi:hypothetical protein